ncbi:hypothetical protein [Gordonia sp. DT101]|uniref:hypothetical protein n=1 Tax=Gordonia sp. DT101 TaxID=3416545 RepID=UPI003CE71F90
MSAYTEINGKTVYSPSGAKALVEELLDQLRLPIEGLLSLNVTAKAIEAEYVDQVEALCPSTSSGKKPMIEHTSTITFPLR